MSRPDFPKPYTVLTPGMISRINSDQAAYDKDPEFWERLERNRKEEQQKQEYEDERSRWQ